MKVAWLHDDPGYVGGAELTMAEFQAAAPEGVEFVERKDAEVVVIGNCMSMKPADVIALSGRRVIRYHHDLARLPRGTELLDKYASHIFTSPLHRERYGLDGEVIPPALELERFNGRSPISVATFSVDSDDPMENYETLAEPPRRGTCSVGSWMNPGKGPHLLREYAEREGEIDVYGVGPYLPAGPNLVHKGAVEPQRTPEVFARYARFVFLPVAVEPFGRCVVEAWASGCAVVTNELVGARHYIQNDPGALQTAAERLWDVIYG
jgi:glycosyltransferase involved in cell wall biosynthesis